MTTIERLMEDAPSAPAPRRPHHVSQHDRNPRTALLIIATWVATIAAAMPLGPLVPLGWLPPVIAAVIVLAAVGIVVRRTRLASWATLFEVAITATAAVILFPTPEAAAVRQIGPLESLGDVIDAARRRLVDGVAPLEAGAELAWVLQVLVLVVGCAAVFMVSTARVALLAVLTLVIVALIPGLAVPTIAPLWAAIPLIVMVPIILLLSESLGLRNNAASARWRVIAGAAMTLAAVAASALIAPRIDTASPEPVLSGGTRVDTSLDLGRDLRRPVSTEVLQFASSATTAPYLRLATLSNFNGDTWLPDVGPSAALDEFGVTQPYGDAVAVTREVSHIEITGLDADALPVPYAATDLTGITDGWAIRPNNLTIYSLGGQSRGANYSVEWARPELTGEQAHAATSSTSATTAIPASVRNLAAEVTAGASTPAARAQALQDWFQGPEFSYSLDAPVEQGFDGTGIDAVERFLDERTGYCVHFAGAFALMARSLDIETRIVVGFLPGTTSGQTNDSGERIFTATTHDMHAWPEIFLDGIGWIPFEPTKSLGTPTDLALTDEASGDNAVDPTTEPDPEPEVTTQPQDEVERDDEPAGDETTTTDSLDLSWLPVTFASIAGAALLLSVPAMIRRLRRRRRLRATHRPARALWREVEDLLVDAGEPVFANETPRAVAHRLIARGAPADAVHRLLADVERLVFADTSTARTGNADDVTAVRAALFPTAGSRATALVLPKSVVRRARSR